ncbi:PWWP domain [Trinorchestia longiramus]|nr:PWWP domain [Trinorchestia longiramus]
MTLDLLDSKVTETLTLGTRGALCERKSLRHSRVINKCCAESSVALRAKKSTSKNGRSDFEMRVGQRPGRLVWGKLKGHRHWPAVEVLSLETDRTVSARRSSCIWVLWFGDLLLSKVERSCLEEFCEAFEEHFSWTGPPLFTRAVTQALRVSESTGTSDYNNQLLLLIESSYFFHYQNKTKPCQYPIFCAVFWRELCHCCIHLKRLDSFHGVVRKWCTAGPLRASLQVLQLCQGEEHSQRAELDILSTSTVTTADYQQDCISITSLCVECSHERSVGNSGFEWEPGTLVWGKLAGYSRWPGLTICSTWCSVQRAEKDHVWIFWFGDHYISKVRRTAVSHFSEDFVHRAVAEEGTLLRQAVLEALRESCYQRGITEHLNDSPAQLLAWGASAVVDPHFAPCQASKPGGVVSLFVRHKLARLCRLRHRRTSLSSPADTSSDSEDVDNDEEVDTTDDEAPLGPKWLEKAEQLRQVRENELAVERVCVACVSVTCSVQGLHPLFLGGCCAPCQEALSLVLVELDHSSIYCVVCAAPGRLLLCDEPQCCMVFCTECIELLVGRAFMEKTVASCAPWSCFLCSVYTPSTHGLLRPRPHWRLSLEEVRRDARLLLPCDQVPRPRTGLPLKPLRVLSLFDGISTGLYCLDELGVSVEVYYSSEVCEAALTVSEKHFRGRVIRLGDVTKINDEQISALAPIHLVLGGSPCSDLSAVNPNRKGLFDPSGTGILFFEFVRILKSVARVNKQHGLFWLFENVASMPVEYRNTISKHLHCEPVTVDARWFTPMKRRRLFWGNIPGLRDLDRSTVRTRPTKLKDFVEQIFDRNAQVSHLRCVTTCSSSTSCSDGMYKPITMRGRSDAIWITELEKLFGLPAHFTDVANQSPSQRQALLGKAWSVHVIMCILQPLTSLFQTVSGR